MMVDKRIEKGHAHRVALGSSSLASILMRGYNSVNKDRVLAKSLQLKPKDFSCEYFKLNMYISFNVMSHKIIQRAVG